MMPYSDSAPYSKRYCLPGPQENSGIKEHGEKPDSANAISYSDPHEPNNTETICITAVSKQDISMAERISHLEKMIETKHHEIIEKLNAMQKTVGEVMVKNGKYSRKNCRKTRSPIIPLLQ